MKAKLITTNNELHVYQPVASIRPRLLRPADETLMPAVVIEVYPPLGAQAAQQMGVYTWPASLIELLTIEP